MVRDASMKIMSSGSGVFFIQNCRSSSCGKRNSMPGVGPEVGAVHQAVFARRRRVGDLNGDGHRPACGVHDDVRSARARRERRQGKQQRGFSVT